MTRKRTLSQALNNKFNLEVDWTKLRKEDLEQVAALLLNNRALAKVILRSEIEERRKSGPIISFLRDAISEAILS